MPIEAVLFLIAECAEVNAKNGRAPLDTPTAAIEILSTPPRNDRARERKA